jgi:hypothetical protein
MLGSDAEGRAPCECDGRARCEALHSQGARIAVNPEPGIDCRCHGGPVQPLGRVGLMRVRLESANRLQRCRRLAPPLQRRQRDRPRHIQVVVVWMLTKERLEDVEPLVRPAGPNQDGGFLTAVRFIGAETNLVFLQPSQGRAVVPAPAFSARQLDQGAGRVRLQTQVPRVSVNGRIRLPGPRRDTREVQDDVVIVRLKPGETLVGVPRPPVIAAPGCQRRPRAEEVHGIRRKLICLLDGFERFSGLVRHGEGL